MEYRLVRGRNQQWQEVALMRGPVVYRMNNTDNPWLKEKVDVVVDPRSIGEAVPDDSFRPGGLRCSALTAGQDNRLITFTEFIDPAGIKTFFFIPRGMARSEPDELVARQFNPYIKNP